MGKPTDLHLTDQPDLAEGLTPRGVTWLGFATDLTLAGGKVLAGVLFASQTLLADGLHSGSDLMTDLAVLAGLHISQKPADADHPYGHLRVNALVALAVGIALVAAAGWIAYHGAMTLRHRNGQAALTSAWPMVVAILSVGAKETLFRLTRRVARQTDNSSLMANAWHHRSDAFTSVAAAVGLGAVAIGGSDWAFLDSVTAMALSAFLVLAGVRIISESIGELMDASPDEAIMEEIQRIVGDTPGVISFHAVRARKLGGRIEMDVHIEVRGDLTVREGHDIASHVTDRIHEADRRMLRVIVHVEPDGRA